MLGSRRRETAASLVLGAMFSVVLVHCSSTQVPRKSSAPPRPKSTRATFHHEGRFWYFFDNVEYAKATGDKPASVRLWVALPLTRRGQNVEIGKIEPPPNEIIRDPIGGNVVVYWRKNDLPEGTPFTFYYDFSVENQGITFDLDPAKARRVGTDAPEYKQYTGHEPWLEKAPGLAERARAIVGAEPNPLKQAKLVFDWIVENVTYDYPHVKDRGVKRSFARLKGDCGEFSHIFIAMMRALGVPARSIFCVWYQGGGHAWAEIFVPPYGWIPVDTSGAQLVRNGLKGQMTEPKVKEFMKTRGIPTRNPDYLFGNLYPNRLEVFVGENVTFKAKSDGESRTYRFMQPGGKASWPVSIEVEGLSRKTIHGGFFMFGKDARSLESARALAEEQLAPAYLSAGLYERAKRGLLKIVKKKPTNATALFQLGQAHFNLHEYRDAVDALRRSIAGTGGSLKRTTDTWAHVFIGMAHDAEGRRDQAIAEYNKAIATGADYGGSLSTAKKFLQEPYTPDKKK